MQRPAHAGPGGRHTRLVLHNAHMSRLPSATGPPGDSRLINKATSEGTLQTRNRAVTGLMSPALRNKVPFIRDMGI